MNFFKQILSQYPFIVAYICSWLFFLITRHPEIIILLKTENQRTDDENSEVERGLRRTLFFDAFVIVPASVTLCLLIVFPFMLEKFPGINSRLYAWYGLMGVISYGFPFLAFRQAITRIALTTTLTVLRETLQQLTKVSKTEEEQEEQEKEQKGEEEQENDKTDKSN